MEEIKLFLKKHWAVIVWATAVIIDKEYGLAESIFNETWQISLFQIAGALILSYKWVPVNSKLNVSASEGAVRPDRPR